ncbi:MAG: ATP-binding protein [Cyanobacteria bacterium J06638_28]
MTYGDSQTFSSTHERKIYANVAAPLGMDSTLQELPLHSVCLSLDTAGTDAAALFERSPELPGILLSEHERIIGFISRERFLEYLLRPYGIDLFLSQPLAILFSYTRSDTLKLPQNTPILVAAQAALRRPVNQQGEPIWVTHSNGDQLLNSYDLNVAHWHIRGIETQVRYERAQAYMLQSQKMSALGRLVDGVAHEMLDPLSFIWGNLTHVAHYCNHLMELLAAYEAVLPPEVKASSSLVELCDAIELDYLKEDLPDTLRSIKGGAERLKRLATSLQNFCHIDEVYPQPADLHELIDSIVLLLQSRLKTRIQVIRHYSSLPPITCYAGQLGQVFMNILTNCVDALLAKTAQADVSTELGLAIQKPILSHVLEKPKITITTRFCTMAQEKGSGNNRWISITFADNGPGLPHSAQQQVLQSFSIEQRLEKETDLAMSYRIITAKHGGRFYVRSQSFSDQETAPDVGTEFEIRLPLYGSPQ